MAELSREHIIEIRIGTGEPPSMRIRPGEPVGPMLVGSDGAWALQGPGVAAEHAELYFDGSQLFVRSVNPSTPAVVGGRPIPGVWTALEPPCEISLGGGQLWFGPDVPRAAAPARMNVAQLLEDDDNIATRVADQQKEPSWGNVGEMVQRGMAASHAPAAGARLPPPEPPPPPPVPAFWPSELQAAAPPPPPDHLDGPSHTTRKDDSGMTKIEPVEEVERRREMSLSSGRRFPQVGDLSTSGSSYPRVGVASTAPPLTVSGSSYPRAAPVPTDDGRPTAVPYGGTEVLQSSPMPPSARPAPSSAPGSVPSFGAPPPPSIPAPGQLPPGVLPPPPMDYSRFTGTHPQVHISLSPPSMQQPTTTEGVVHSASGTKLSGPKKALIALFPLLIAAVAVLFLGEELGLEPKPQRKPATTAKPSTSVAGQPTAPSPVTSAAVEPGPAASASAAGTAPPEPIASAAVPEPTASAKETPPDPARSPRATQGQQVKGAGERSLQRQAADAVAAGLFARAAELYDQLAKEHPNKPAYAEAAAIMREKAGLK